ncbi:MAG: hypothetical protein ACYYKD_05925 [Rhodospirillales bacterium]
MTFSDTRIAAVSCALLLAPFWLIYGPLFPAPPVGAGSDFNLHYPNLLAGYFWIEQNGWLRAPWFSPAQCAGTPYLGDLNVAFYSLPQVLTQWGGPTFAVRATAVIFAALGYLGAFALARGTLRASIPAAVLAGAFIMFNAFFVYRIAVGHLTFHPIMLAPGTAWIVLGGGAVRESWRRIGLRALLAGASFAVMFHAGMIHAIIPVALFIAGLWAVLGLRDGELRAGPVVILALAAVGAGLLSAARLQAALSFMAQFPRADYPLPGFAGLWDALAAPFQGVFLTQPYSWAEAALANRQFSLAPHEWKYGISAAALILLLAGAARRLWVSRAEDWRPRADVRADVRAEDWPPGVNAARISAAAVLAAVLVLPVAVNMHGEAWTALLKTVPVLGQSSSLLRWYVVYTLLGAVLAGCALDWVTQGLAAQGLAAERRTRWAFAAVALAVLTAWSALQDHSRDEWHDYDGRPVEDAYQARAGGGPVPAVAALVMRTLGGAGRYGLDVNRNNAMAQGESEILCNQPMFGYTLENFPLGETFTGDITEEDDDGGLNIKNPACYQYPAENQCAPGDSFLLEHESGARDFAAYRAFPFERPLRHDIAVWVNLAALILLPFGILFCVWRRRE